ncbi:MAG: GNAT family N-acetyltransferase [Rhizobiaceae bacterium]|nr:GNAT family N-acetyltransferase [Rhizobiaceae bacterium]
MKHTPLEGEAGPSQPRVGFVDSSALAGRELGRIGTLSVRLAANQEEVHAAQHVRFRVFGETFGTRNMGIEERDADRFDEICDHLLVMDDALPGRDHDRIVGTYRLLRQDRAASVGGFYSSAMFDVEGMVARHPGVSFLEVGRSCVLPQYRTKRTIDTLWLGIWAYIRHYEIAVLTGCASFAGTDPAAHATALSFLAHHCSPETEWRVDALPNRAFNMDLLPRGSYSTRAAIASMPPLIKGYLRLGAQFGRGCVIDREMGTVVVLVVLPIENLAERYVRHYTAREQPRS